MNKDFIITCSLVCYKNDKVLLRKAIDSFLNNQLNCFLFIIDNSPTNDLEFIITDDRVNYLHNPTNPGFGVSHNIGIFQASVLQSKYHLILNPDIYFESGVLESLINYMDQNSEVGLVMPKILYPDKRLQRLGKLLPTPMDYIVRRFVPFYYLKNKINYKYELHAYQYDHPMEVPFLSGCFMLSRTKILKDIGGFDENIFMYTEDTDICRRIKRSGYKTILYPDASVFHDHKKKSVLEYSNLKIFVKSAFYYFQKWGWILDADRKTTNRKILNQLKK